MMRIFAFLLSVLMFCFIFVGCAPLPVESEKTDQLFEQVNLVQLSSDNSVRYCRDTVTDVMYICFIGYRKAGLSVMLEPDTGLPLTYSRYIELFADVEN